MPHPQPVVRVRVVWQAVTVRARQARMRYVRSRFMKHKVCGMDGSMISVCRYIAKGYNIAGRRQEPTPNRRSLRPTGDDKIYKEAVHCGTRYGGLARGKGSRPLGCALYLNVINWRSYAM